MMSRFKLTKLEFGYLSAGSATIYFVCSPFGWSFCWGIPCISAGSAGIFNCRLTVGRLLCQALLVKVFVRIVNSRWLEFLLGVSLVSQLVQLVSFNCRLTVGRLLCQALLVKVFVKIVDSRRLESEKVTNSLGLLGQNLLVYFEG